MSKNLVSVFCISWTILLCFQLLSPVLTEDHVEVSDGEQPVPVPVESPGPVEEATKANFVELAKNNPYLLVLFYEPGCMTCEEAKETFNTIIEPDMFPGSIKKIRMNDAELASTLSAGECPSVVLLRNGGNPVIYDGAQIDKDGIESWLAIAHEKSTQMLNDESFEHLTQASTGATTGDWLVAFYKSTCPSILPIMESFGVRMKRKMNTAKVDMDESPRLVKRLKVSKCPTVIYFRQGKMYRYEVEKYDSKSLTSFVEGWYKNMKAEKVPAEPTGFDEVTENIAKALKEQLEGPNRFVFLAIVAGVSSLVLLISICACVVSKRNAEKKKKLY